MCGKDKTRVELIGQCHDAPGFHMSPDIAVLSSCSEEVKIKGSRGCAVVDCFVHIIFLRCFGKLVAGMGVKASAGDLIHVSALPHLEGGFVRRSGWLSQVLQWAGLRAPPMRERWHTVVFFGRI